MLDNTQYKSRPLMLGTPHEESSESSTTDALPFSLQCFGRSGAMRHLPVEEAPTKKSLKKSSSHKKKSKKSSSKSKNKRNNKNKNEKKRCSFDSDSKCHDGGSQELGVQFAESQEVHKVVPRLSSFSPEELQSIWFDGEEFQDFIDEAWETVEKMEQGKELRDKKYTALGLENFTQEGQALKNAHREDAYDAVMFEQEEQYQQGRRDSGQLADAYFLVSKESQRRAIHLALQLRKDVIKYLMNDDINVKNKKKKRTRMAKRRSSF